MWADILLFIEKVVVNQFTMAEITHISVLQFKVWLFGKVIAI